MNKIKKLGLLFDELADELNITPTMLEKAETAYTALGEHIKSANENWDVSIYPQGSFELGTVIRPVNDEEEYDVDLVVLVKSPVLDPKQLREEVKTILLNHGRYEKKLEDKKPCIRIQYAESAQFHMDIACAKDIASGDDTIEIARRNGSSIYFYEISNPKGYIDWFKRTMQYDALKRSGVYNRANTEVQNLTLSRMRTPLQKAIQVLKRHRDIYFSQKPTSENKPSSIIITTLCAKAYEDTQGSFEKDNVYLTILNMLQKFPQYLSRTANGYYLENPSRPQENFLKKWNEDGNLVAAFIEWIERAQEDIITCPEAFIEDDPKALRERLHLSFGQHVVSRTFERYGTKFAALANGGKLLFDQKSGNIVSAPSQGTPYGRHTFFGGDS